VALAAAAVLAEADAAALASALAWAAALAAAETDAFALAAAFANAAAFDWDIAAEPDRPWGDPHALSANVKIRVTETSIFLYIVFSCLLI
jgi:hypothetical protein